MLCICNKIATEARDDCHIVPGRSRSNAGKDIRFTYCYTFCESSDIDNRTYVAFFQLTAQRYKQLLFFATKLEPLAVEFKTEENKVKGCVSQVWMVPDLQEDGTVHWKADSDSQLTKVWPTAVIVHVCVCAVMSHVCSCSCL